MYLKYRFNLIVLVVYMVVSLAMTLIFINSQAGGATLRFQNNTDRPLQPIRNGASVKQENAFTQVEEEQPVEIIVRVARAHDIDPLHLLALSYQESYIGQALVGDNGCSHGYFHINLCANSDAKDIIGDVEKEATWAAQKLIQYGYADGLVETSFARYNAPYKPNYQYAARVFKRINQVKPICQNLCI